MASIKWSFDNERPIYTQIIEQLRQAIASRELCAGERLPSVRDMAADAGVNPNTMQRAFAELERMGLVYANRTSGRFITEDNDLIRSVRLELARESVEAFVRSMEKIGFSRSEIVRLLENYEKGDDDNERK